MTGKGVWAEGTAYQAFVLGEKDSNTSINFTHGQLDEHCEDHQLQEIAR